MHFWCYAKCAVNDSMMRQPHEVRVFSGLTVVVVFPFILKDTIPNPTPEIVDCGKVLVVIQFIMQVFPCHFMSPVSCICTLRLTRIPRLRLVRGRCRSPPNRQLTCREVSNKITEQRTS